MHILQKKAHAKKCQNFQNRSKKKQTIQKKNFLLKDCKCSSSFRQMSQNEYT